jgi:hypothetical protein
VVDAGAGDDHILGLLETASCGDGADSIAVLTLELNRKPPAADCEFADYYGTRFSARPVLAKRRARFTVRSRIRATATISLHRGKKRLGITRFTLARKGAGRSRTVSVKLARRPAADTLITVRLTIGHSKSRWHFRA